MDSRPYFLTYLTQPQPRHRGWCFIAREGEYKSQIIPLEKWTDNTKTVYTMYRICYDKIEASNLTQNAANNHISMMEGPNIYCVIRENENVSVITVWKPTIEGYIEIINGNYEFRLVDEKLDFDNIKKIIIQMMKLENVETESLAPTDLKSYCLTINNPVESTKKYQCNDELCEA